MRFRKIAKQASLSFDFWGTLLVKNHHTFDSHRAVLKQLKREFSLDVDCDLMFSYWEDICEGQLKFNHQSNFDQEFSMEDSYFFLANLLFADKPTVDSFVERAIALELEIFFKNSRPNIRILKLLESRNWGLNDVIISDFEGSAVFIKKLLDMHDIKWQGRIFTSSDCGRSKRTSRIYNHILQNIEISCHIGDHLFSDYLNSKRCGIASCLLVKESTLLLLHILISKFSRQFLRFSYFSRRSFEILLGCLIGKTALCATLNRYISNLRSLEETDSLFLYMGSEGAFFSQLYFKKYHNPKGTHLCLSISRIDLLDLIGSFNPQTQVARLLIDKSDSNVYKNILQSRKNGNFLPLSRLVHKNHLTSESKNLLTFLSNLDRENFRKVIVVDIGYNHTAAFCIDRMMVRQVIAAQMIGFERISQSSKFSVLNTVKLSRLYDSRFLRTRYLEFALSTGPRSKHFLNLNFQKFQERYFDSSSIAFGPWNKRALFGYATFPDHQLRKFFKSEQMNYAKSP